MGGAAQRDKSLGSSAIDDRCCRDLHLRSVPAELHLFHFVAGRPRDRVLLLADQAIYLDVSFVSRARSVHRSYGRMAGGFGSTVRFGGIAYSVLPRARSGILARRLRYHLLAAGPR